MNTAVLLGAIDVSAETCRVSAVRYWLRDLLGTDHPAVFEVELLGSELITNAVLYSDSAMVDDQGRPGIVSIAVLAIGPAIRVEVTDARSARSVPHVVDADADAISGRGLLLVREITGGRCGTRTHGTRRTVWFELNGTDTLRDRS